MPADLDALVAMMPFAGQLGLVLDEADALVAQTIQVQAVK